MLFPKQGPCPAGVTLDPVWLGRCGEMGRILSPAASCPEGNWLTGTGQRESFWRRNLEFGSSVTLAGQEPLNRWGAGVSAPVGG